MSARTTRTGIVFLILGIAIFSVQDVILKLMSGDYPLWQAMLIRSLTALPLHLAIARAMDGRLGTIITPGWPWMLARGGLMCVAYTAYYLGLARLPMAETVALFFTAPLFITAVAALVFRDRIGPVTWAALAAGAAGVAMILRPGAGVFDPAALLPVLGALGYASSMLAARALAPRETAAAMAFWSNLAYLSFSLGLAAVFGSGALSGAGGETIAFLTRGWVPLTAGDAGSFALCGVIAAVGMVLLTQAYRLAPPATLAPFEYSFILWALLWGWLIWGDWPVPLTWAGIAVLIGAGLAVIRAEAPARSVPGGADRPS